MTGITITRAGPMATLQDAGRFGMLRHGISASGPMDRSAFHAAGAMLGEAGGTAIEFSQGLAFTADDALEVSVAGGQFNLRVNDDARDWPARLNLAGGDRVEITPGAVGNYAYLRFRHEIDVPLLLGSRSTNVIVGLGGYKGRTLRAGDAVRFAAAGPPVREAAPGPAGDGGDIRVVWGIHADLFDAAARERFVTAAFVVSNRLDRMGVRLIDETGVFRDQRRLSLVSDAIVPGDIQILGDGTPIVLMRDHQPTGGYPRIATVVTADFDRFAQVRPGTPVRFRPVLPGRRK